MTWLHGTVVCGGIVSAPAYVLHHPLERNPSAGSLDASSERQRLEQAISTVRENLSLRMEQTDVDTERDILEIHRMMLEDEDVLDCLRNAVQQNGTTAEEAVFQTEQYFSTLFSDTGDNCMIARIDDIRDVSRELLNVLSPQETSEMPDKPMVLVADQLLPGELLQLNCQLILGIVMGSGTVYSHTAILIKEKGIPAIICEHLEEPKTGSMVLLDADNGAVCFSPDDTTMENHRRKEHLAGEKPKASVFSLWSKTLYVNVGNPQDVTQVLMARCDGIGLFRSEYLYIDKPSLPDEEEQFQIYRTILHTANGKNVTIRTFDLGSDKTAVALPLKNEANPALGIRGLRVYSLYPEAFKTQIRALLRAAVFGNLRIMYPMAISCKEIANIKQLVAHTAQELETQNIPWRIPLQGAMIETPAAALLSDELAQMVDFFSVGTNDLTQYTLALDRHNGYLSTNDDDAGLRAILALIRMAAENAHKHGIEIGICGEMASQPQWINQWIQMGIDYLSVAQACLPK